MENSNVQTAPQTNQIEDNKPNVEKTYIPITGHIGCSMNGGHWRTMHWQYVMAGQHLQKGVLNLNVQMLTPKTPAFQRLTCKVMLVYVPHERVWTNYLEYIAQRGGNTVEKIKQKPNYGGKILPKIEVSNGGNLCVTNTTAWRDHWISAYIPRIKTQKIVAPQTGTTWLEMPSYDALPARAFIAAYNDVLRNREYESEYPEYKEMDTVSEQEWYDITPHVVNERINVDVQQMRCRRNTSYYTNYRTELQGLDIEAPSNTDSERALLEWSSWESKIDLARENAMNAQMRDIDILAKIRGSKKLSESRTQIIAQKTFDLNYSAITQSAYNTNEQIEEKFQVMGQQGAYSYTNVSLPIGEDTMFLSDGTLHVIACVTADTVFETGLNRRAMTINAIDEYRPELVDDKLDVIYEYEFGTEMLNIFGDAHVIDFTKIRGFKQKFSEYFAGMNVIQGDMTTNGYLQTESTGTAEWRTEEENPIESNHTYQFFETSAEIIIYYNNSLMSNYKKVYYDYTDIHINNNQAILNNVGRVSDPMSESSSYYIQGQNQIFMVGNYTILTTIPVSEKIVMQYSKWGEH